MAARDDRYKDIDQHITANLRTYREAGNVHQVGEERYAHYQRTTSLH